jgi:hypothetical protein
MHEDGSARARCAPGPPSRTSCGSEDIGWLDDGQRKQLFESNARELFRI